MLTEPLKYLQTYESESTTRIYRYVLRNFLSNIYGEGDLETLAGRYFKDTRDYESDVKDFLAEIKGRPPKTVRLMLSAVRTFLIENKVELSQRFWRGLSRRVKGSSAVTVDKVPSNTELRRIVMHMPVHGKALYLSLASSGMRIGEALKLTLDSIDLNNDPPKISIRGEWTKTGDKRITFISAEAKEHVEEWLKYRKDYLTSASGRSWKYNKSVDDKRLFPFSPATAQFIWTNALEKSELNHRDSATNRYKIHVHVLRKFFRSNMGAASVDMTEALMGHKGYLTRVYRKYADAEKELGQFYKLNETRVMIFGHKEEIATLRKEVEERNKELQQRVNRLTTANLDLQASFKKLEERFEEEIKRVEKEFNKRINLYIEMKASEILDLYERQEEIKLARKRAR